MRSLLDPYQDPHDPKDTLDVHKYRDNLLFKAADRIDTAVLRTRRDKIGIICLEYPSFVLVARRYIFHGVVSVHRTIINYAKESGKKIVMFVDEENGFFVFDSMDKILAVSTPNKRGYSDCDIMENFPVNIGFKLVEKTKEDLHWVKKKSIGKGQTLLFPVSCE
jgi:hypothetical protein